MNDFQKTRPFVSGMNGIPLEDLHVGDWFFLHQITGITLVYLINWETIQGNQLYMAVFLWYLLKRDLSSVR